MFGGFGNIGSLPKNTKLADLRSPDRIPSFSIHDCELRGQDILEVMEVKDDNGVRIGAIVLVARGEPTTGKLIACGVATFTTEEINGHAGL